MLLSLRFCRRACVLLLTAAAALLPLPPAHAEIVVIGDFEGGSYDGWVPLDGFPVFFSHSTVGATLGSSALQVTVDPNLGFTPLALLDSTPVAPFLAASSLQMDVTYDRSLFASPFPPFDNQGAAFVSLFLQGINQTNAQAVGAFGVPTSDDHFPPTSWPGNWEYGNLGMFPDDATTMTLTFDFTQDLTFTPPQSAPWLTAHNDIAAVNPEYVQIFLQFSATPELLSGALIVDNIRLNVVPEPASGTLLILGAVALLITRRLPRG